ncbi:uncharacterized protein TM35_000082510 [Trypanosoma theileri]|uniref:RanBP2-type domain-containing protein n=1 Tax=Trypanosoma theileri TaxID=67003 RepID=A0A1X0P169_9TRYP|nr:uncharacterized protein TM35_000082510 [Trypanosoma theileri]ORC90453.1 hypothetical protein TM35_000082510 [Trypanosoma theileri]
MLRKPLGAGKRPFFLRRFARARVDGASGAGDDVSLIVHADFHDDKLSQTALTTSAELVQQSPEALLNNANRPLLVPLLQLLRRRGALNDNRVRQEIVRFLVPSVHRDYLSWLWGDNVESTGLVEAGNITALRSLPPFAWRATIEQGKPTEPSELLHYWHQVFFALSANAVFADVGFFDEGHRELLSIIHDYYVDVARLQRLLPLLDETIVITRMPPVFVRKLRKFYVERYRLLQYAELFRAIVDGEELVMPTYGTALLNDAEVFEYYITIPGRRESGIERDERWSSTLAYAMFAFSRLFRQQKWQGSEIDAIMTRPATLFMNVCVFSKNDNAEGERFREAILAVMRVFHTHYRNESKNVIIGNNSFLAYDVLRILRDTGVDSMLAKCKRLHFGPIHGLLDVCTLAAVTEMLLCGEEETEGKQSRGYFDFEELEVLLSSRKNIGTEMYNAVKNHKCHRFAAHYGVLNLSPRIKKILEEVVQSSSSLHRYTNELSRWVTFIGWPLRLTMQDILPNKELTLSIQKSLIENPVEYWQCGCQYMNPTRPKSISCIGCVSRDLVEHQWICPHCSWVSASGDYVNICLRCRQPHPNSQARARENEINDPSAKSQSNSLIWYCNLCSSYSPLVCDGTETTQGCIDCGTVGNGWSVSYFDWKCGCGEMNSPFRRWCYACSVHRQHACCQCLNCKQPWTLSPRGTRERTESHSGCFSSSSSLSCSSCLSCGDPHPRETAAWQRRLLRCPLCHSLTSTETTRTTRTITGVDSNNNSNNDSSELDTITTTTTTTTGTVCQHCSHSLTVLRQFVALQPDWPWRCHSCGRHQHIRDSDGALITVMGQTQPPETTETCGNCGTIRLDPVLFDRHATWSCVKCGERAVHGFHCHRCLSLHPAIPETEVHAWRCVTCLTINSGWNDVCQRPDCGVRRSVDSTPLPYSPWRCCSCGEYSRTTQIPQCEHCNVIKAAPLAAIPAPVPLPTKSVSAYNVAERRAQRLAEVETQLLNAAALMDEDEQKNEDGSKVNAENNLTDEWTQFVADGVRLAIPLG